MRNRVGTSFLLLIVRLGRLAAIFCIAFMISVSTTINLGYEKQLMNSVYVFDWESAVGVLSMFFFVSTVFLYSFEEEREFAPNFDFHQGKIDK